MKICGAIFLIGMFFLGCDSRYREDLDYSYNVSQTWTVEEIESGELVQFESVELDLIASATIRQAIAEDNVAASRDVLHIGSGTGLVAAMCLVYEANSVLATDVLPAGIANTRYNVAALAPDGKLTTRLRPASQRDAFSAIESDEKYDLIITNFDQTHHRRDETIQAGSDTFDGPFLTSFLEGLSSHLKSGGRAIVECSRPETIKQFSQAAKTLSLKVKSLEEDFENRDWESASTPMIPDVLFEIRPKVQTSTVSQP